MSNQAYFAIIYLSAGAELVTAEKRDGKIVIPLNAKCGGEIQHWCVSQANLVPDLVAAAEFALAALEDKSLAPDWASFDRQPRIDALRTAIANARVQS